MKGNYNNIAPYYDRLSQVIFGRAIINAQKYLVGFITTGNTILIVGGGTGWILEEIAKRHFEGLQITYLEISEKMIDLSVKRDWGKNKVIFINKSIQEVAIDGQFDIVMTPFLLDNFSPKTVELVFEKIHKRLSPSGLWLFTDFQVNPKHKYWQKPLLKIMYLFFKLCCNIEAGRLPDTSTLFDRFRYKKTSSKMFFHNFICSQVFQQQNN